MSAVGGDAEAASNAVHELFGNIWHQGSVYPATEYAVPFLARMAAAGLASRDLAQLLGCIAEGGDYLSATPADARAAFAAQVNLLAPIGGNAVLRQSASARTTSSE